MVAELVIPETRRLATFRTVDAIEPIEGADAIELAVLGGWKVVCKKGDFNVGDPCIYLECDAFLPDGVPAWQFLIDKSPRMMNGVKGHRLRTIKLRGQISQGLILKTSDHPATKLVLALDEAAAASVEGCTPEQIEEATYLRKGMDEHSLDPRDLNLNKLLGIVKWDPPMSAQLAGMAEGLFPSFIRKTDQERAQNLKEEIFGFDDLVIPANPDLNRPEIIRPAKGDRNAKYEITMKLDGSSGTYFVRSKFSEPIGVDGVRLDPPEVGVCSRNLELKINEANAENTFVKVGRETGLFKALEQYYESTGQAIAVQGEVMGPAIQGNREELKTHEFYVFDIFDIGAHAYLSPSQRAAALGWLAGYGAKIKHVPIIAHEANLHDTLGIATMDQLIKFAEGPSIKHPIREGLVFKRLDGQFTFKVISNKYLEKEKD
jgi:RNA ligase (TIGR02306 family)